MGGSRLQSLIEAIKRSAQEDAKSSGRWLGLAPLVAALAFAPLLIPHATPPDAVPLPAIDRTEIERVAALDHELASKARTTQLPAEVRAVGTALREFMTLQSTEAREEQVARPRAALDKAVLGALSIDGGLAMLRAVNLEEFLAQVRAFEKTGVESEELRALGGGFVRRMREDGWCVGSKLLLTEAELRAMYKATWNAAINAPPNPSLAPTLDETRAVYALYLRAPHPSASGRAIALTQRKNVRDAKACAEIAANEELDAEKWRFEKIQKLATIDPTYPANYAMGVSQYRMHRYHQSVQSFTDWLTAHPEGALATLARNHLIAAKEAESSY